MCPSLVEIRSVTSEIGIKKGERKKEKTTVVKYKAFGIAMPCGIITESNHRRECAAAMPLFCDAVDLPV